MNEKDAREIVHQYASHQRVDMELHREAKGYLEALEHQRAFFKKTTDSWMRDFEKVNAELFRRVQDEKILYMENEKEWQSVLEKEREKAKGLEEAAKEVTGNDYCLEPTYTERPNAEGDDVIEDTVFCGKCELCKLREALAKYRSEK